ncbi:MAG: hypothetical protein ABH811_02495 [archaeon]
MNEGEPMIYPVRTTPEGEKIYLLCGEGKVKSIGTKEELTKKYPLAINLEDEMRIRKKYSGETK